MSVTTARQFRELLSADQTEFLMEAHDGLSARIVAEAGFKGIWASGLCISAALGVRDNNEASWTQVLDVVEYMTDAVSIPILLDADTGYGNFNNVRRLVRKLEQRRVAAMCIEDKLFPKTNSFIGGEQQPLAEVDEFVGKIKAAKDTQQDQNFTVVARVEALIAGWGLDEALRRADAYQAAGADAILIHSKLRTAEQIVAFMREWGQRCPVIIVPTTYCATPTEVFEQAGVRIVIWANHLLRSSITAMQTTTAAISRTRSVAELEPVIASVQEVFRLQDADELKTAERRYLPVRQTLPKAVMWSAAPEPPIHQPLPDAALADAARHHRTDAPHRGGAVVHQQVAQLHAAGVRDVVILQGLTGNGGASTSPPAVVDSPAADGAPLASLACALDGHAGSVLVWVGDALVPPQRLAQLLQESGDIVLLVDALAECETGTVHFDHLVRCDRAWSRHDASAKSRLVAFQPEDAHGEWAGVAKFGPAGLQALQRTIDQWRGRSDFGRLEFRDVLAHLADGGTRLDVVFMQGRQPETAAPVVMLESDQAYAPQYDRS